MGDDQNKATQWSYGHVGIEITKNTVLWRVDYKPIRLGVDDPSMTDLLEQMEQGERGVWLMDGVMAKIFWDTLEGNKVVSSDKRLGDPSVTMADRRRQEIGNLKKGIAEENEDPQGPVSRYQSLDTATIVELDFEHSVLEIRLRGILISKLKNTSGWKREMELLPLIRLQSMRASNRSALFTIGDASESEVITDKRQTR
ncbi:uncharacterized protein TRUGW13939_11557 [Talaromyces rugulosus]|uniref:Uncharacterized protein n=1 Tax=Talaromyces rugulosus TaxID=121627 RepID=A0A7H8RIE7_TALRU|nr:uncharacterized protein TRUGW13939_11557 [Talaromyces rugulosus]QKX64383.1 hypothetical protein TRUGW13939_11557 [Talaromyces rugulosus]